MVTSKQVSPHAFSVVEVDFANVDATRSESRRAWKEREGFSLTYLPFISRAVADGLREFPHLNASVDDKELVVHERIDLGIAVDLDYEGLIVPVIRNADTKSVGDIAREINDLATAHEPQAVTRRRRWSDVHDLQQRLGRLGADDGDHQPAPGRDLVDRRHRREAGRRGRLTGRRRS